MSAHRAESARDAYRTELIRLLTEAFKGPAWHGASLRSTLRGITWQEALWRPAPGRNTIWDLTVHAARGKHIVLQRLAPEAAGRFPRRLPRTWWPRTAAEDAASGAGSAAAWNQDLALLEESHRALVDAVSTVPVERLYTRRRGRRDTIGQEVSGIALHDVYHAGQIRLLHKMSGSVKR